MSMDRFYRYNTRFLRFPEMRQPTQFREIPKCFVRKDHSCGKFLGASKSCFIACPSTEEVETILALIIEKLTKIGIEPVIAIKERAYGQDIFCTKICGKIIESQFCLVILDDTMESVNGSVVNIPNSNVYYEYGLMTALGKHVIPLQKTGQQLAFNIQTHDTIKYTPRNISSELDTAFKDAVKITQEERAEYEYAHPPSQRLFSRCLEINGYQKKGYGWFLRGELEDTVFEGYADPSRHGYLLFTVADNRESLRTALTDMQVIFKRLETMSSDLLNEIDVSSTKIDEYNKQLQALEERISAKSGVGVIADRSHANTIRYELNNTIKEREDKSSKIDLIRGSRFAIILTPEITELKEKVVEEYNNIDKSTLSLPLHIGDISSLEIGDLSISFDLPSI